MSCHRELYIRWNTQAEMCWEDKEATERALQLKKREMQGVVDSYEAKLAAINDTLRDTAHSFEKEKRHLEEEIADRDSAIERKDAEADKLRAKVEAEADQRARFERVNMQLLATSDEKDRILSNYREEAVLHIESLTTQIHQLNSDLERLERENDRLSVRVEELEERLEAAVTTEETAQIGQIGENVFEEVNSVATKPVEQSRDGRSLMSAARIKAVMSVLPASVRRTLAVNIKRYAPVSLEGSRSRLEAVTHSVNDINEESDSEVSDYGDDNDSLDTFSDGISEDAGECGAMVECAAKAVPPPRLPAVGASDRIAASLSSLHSFEIREDDEHEDEDTPVPTARNPPTEEKKQPTSVTEDRKHHSSATEGGKQLISVAEEKRQPKPAAVLPEVQSKTSPSFAEKTEVSPEQAKTMLPRPTDIAQGPAMILNPSELLKTPENVTSRKTVRSRQSSVRADSSGSGSIRKEKRIKAARKPSTDGESKHKSRNASVVRKSSSSSDSKPLSALDGCGSGVSEGSSLHEVLSDILEENTTASSKPSETRSTFIVPKAVMRVRHTIMKKLSSLELPPGAGGNNVSQQVVVKSEVEEQEVPVDTIESQSKMLYDYQEGVTDMLEILAPYISPPLTLKVVVTAIRFCVRFKKAAVTKDLSLLGAFGQKVMLKRLESRQNEITAVVSSLTKKVDDNKDNRRAVNQLRNEMNMKMLEHAKEIRELTSEKEALNCIIRSTRVDVIRQHIIAQWQRSVAHELVSLITVMRLRLFTLTTSRSIADDNDDDKSKQQISSGGVPRSRLMHLFAILRQAWRDVIEWNREHSMQRPVRKLKIGNFESFDAFGSRIRNEVRDLSFYRKFVFKDLTKFERRWHMQDEKLVKTARRLQTVIQSKQCPTCVEYENAYKASNEEGKLKWGGNRVANLLNVLKPAEVEELKETLKAEMKVKLRDEIVQEEEKKITQSYTANVTKYLEREYELHDEINALNAKLTERELQEAAVAEERERIRRELDDTVMKLNDLVRQNLVLRTAVKDSYRVCLSEEEELKRSKELIDKMITAAASKTGVDKGTQLYEDHMSLCSEDDGSGILMTRATGDFLLRATVMGVEGSAQRRKGGGGIPAESDVTWLRARDMIPDAPSKRIVSSPPRLQRHSSPDDAARAIAADISNPTRPSKFRQLKNIPEAVDTGAPRRIAFSDAGGKPIVPPISKQRTALMAAYLQAGTTYNRESSTQLVTTTASNGDINTSNGCQKRPLSANLTSKGSNYKHKAFSTGNKSRSTESDIPKKMRPESAPHVKFA